MGSSKSGNFKKFLVKPVFEKLIANAANKPHHRGTFLGSARSGRPRNAKTGN
jgi:hypothetical protein